MVAVYVQQEWTRLRKIGATKGTFASADKVEETMTAFLSKKVKGKQLAKLERKAKELQQQFDRVESLSHSAAIFSILFTPSSFNSATCSGVVNSGPRYKKLGRIVETVNVGNASSVVGGSRSGRAVDGEGGNPRGVPGVWGGV